MSFLIALFLVIIIIFLYMKSSEFNINTSLQEPFYIQTTSGIYLTTKDISALDQSENITKPIITGSKTPFILRREDRYNYALYNVLNEKKIFDNVKIFLYVKSNEYPYYEIMVGNLYLSTNNNFGLDNFQSHATKFYISYV